MDRDSAPTLRDYLAVLRRRWWIIAVMPVVAVAIGFILTGDKKTTYSASAQVLVGRPDIATTLNGLPTVADPDRVTATLARLARVRPIAERVLADTGLDDRTPDDFLAQSSVSESQGVDLLEFSVTDKVSTMATALANAYARAFIDYRRQLDSQSLRAARREVGRRLADLRAAGQRGSADYGALLDQQRQLAALETVSPANGVVVQSANDASASSPNRARAALLAGGLGLVIGVGLAFLAEALDTRVRSSAEVERRFGRPILARLQLRSRQLQKSGALVTIRDPTSREADAFRVLRASFEFANQTVNARSIVVTSAEERDEKTVTAANMAVALARAGRRVILCDLDRTRPALARAFSLEGNAGIADVVMGAATLDDALAPIDLDASAADNGRDPIMAATGSLHVLPLTSSVPPIPGEFVGSKAVADVIAELVRRSDIVVIDAPPLLGPSDAIALSAHVDAIVLVVRWDTFRRRTAAAVERALASAPAEVLGVVLTGTSAADGYELEETYASRVRAGVPANRGFAAPSRLPTELSSGSERGGADGGDGHRRHST